MKGPGDERGKRARFVASVYQTYQNVSDCLPSSYARVTVGPSAACAPHTYACVADPKPIWHQTGSATTICDNTARIIAPRAATHKLNTTPLTKTAAQKQNLPHKTKHFSFSSLTPSVRRFRRHPSPPHPHSRPPPHCPRHLPRHPPQPPRQVPPPP